MAFNNLKETEQNKVDDAAQNPKNQNKKEIEPD